jgi:hypothetical protein
LNAEAERWTYDDAELRTSTLGTNLGKPFKAGFSQQTDIYTVIMVLVPDAAVGPGIVNKSSVPRNFAPHGSFRLVLFDES